MRRYRIPGIEESVFYWSDLGEPTAGGWDHLGELLSAPEAGPHTFTTGTLSWFGTDRIELVGSVGVVERQRKAPEGYEWNVAFHTTTGYRITSMSGPSRKWAKRVVKAYHLHGFVEVES